MNDAAARVVTDRQTDRHTHTPAEQLSSKTVRASGGEWSERKSLPRAHAC